MHQGPGARADNRAPQRRAEGIQEVSVAEDLGSIQQTQYREMKISPGGVMLLVRLHADLSALSGSTLERLSVPEGAADFLAEVDPGSRLAVTLRWLTDRFGHSNCLRAIVESASEIKEASLGTEK